MFVSVFPNVVKPPSTQLVAMLLIGAVVISLVGEAEEGENMRISWSTRAMQIEMICCLMLRIKRFLARREVPGGVQRSDYICPQR